MDTITLIAYIGLVIAVGAIVLAAATLIRVRKGNRTRNQKLRDDAETGTTGK